MSQIIKTLTSGGPFPPNVPTTFQGQNGGVNDGSATPAANTINFNATDVSTNNNSGIEVAAAGSTVTYELTNRIRGTATTTDAATPQQIYSFNLGATPATYLFEVKLVAYNLTDSKSAGYTSYRVTRTDGVTATDISATPGIISEEGTMTGVLAVNSVSGNNYLLTVNGLLGKTIHWKALTTYITVS